MKRFISKVFAGAKTEPKIIEAYLIGGTIKCCRVFPHIQKSNGNL
ncbi:MAG: hypothetical protein PUJ17_02185 [Clostridia bacterium]|nr:hypothetical protein [Clostridia bacterium]